MTDRLAKKLTKLFVEKEEALSFQYDQKVELLSADEEFKEVIFALREKWDKIRIEYRCFFIKYLKAIGRNVLWTDHNMMQNYFDKLYDLREFKPIKSPKFSTDAVAAAKRFNLYPTEEWAFAITRLILEDDQDFLKLLTRANPWFKQASKYGFGTLYNCSTDIKIDPVSKEEIITLKIRPDTSFNDVKQSWSYIKQLQKIIKKGLKSKHWSVLKNIEIKNNDLTQEEEIMLKVYANTSINDIKASWSYINKLQAALKKKLGIKRRYPLKNLKIATQLKELDKKIDSDWDKQEIIFGEAKDNWGEIDTKRRNKIKQIRHQYKKRF